MAITYNPENIACSWHRSYPITDTCKVWIGINVSLPGPAALNIAVGDSCRACIVIVYLGSVLGSIAPQYAVSQDRMTAQGIAYSISTPPGQVPAESAVYNCWTARLSVFHPSAPVCPVAAENTVGESRAAAIVEHPSAIPFCRVAYERAVEQSRTVLR